MSFDPRGYLKYFLLAPSFFFSLNRPRAFMSSLFLLIALLVILKRQALFFMGDILKNIPEPSAPVYVGTLSREPWQVQIYEPAIVDAQDQISVMSKTQGFVDVVHVQTGQHVQRGDALVTLENQESFYALEKGKAAEQLAISSYQRAQELFDKKMISNESYEEALAYLRQAKADRKTLEILFENTVIKSPFDAQVGQVSLSPGQFVSPGNALFEMTTLGPHQINFTLSERYYSFIDLDKEVLVKIGSKVYPAQIDQIGSIADSKTKRFKVSAKLKTDDPSILVGGSAKVFLTWFASEEKVFTLPLEYIDYSALGPTVWTYYLDESIDQYRASPLLVKIIEQNETLCSLEGSDLKEGMPLIISGFQKLRRGGKIKIKEQENLQIQAFKPWNSDRTNDLT